jgi:hypothetical protein
VVTCVAKTSLSEGLMTAFMSTVFFFMTLLFFFLFLLSGLSCR